MFWECAFSPHCSFLHSVCCSLLLTQATADIQLKGTWLKVTVGRLYTPRASGGSQLLLQGTEFWKMSNAISGLSPGSAGQGHNPAFWRGLQCCCQPLALSSSTVIYLILPTLAGPKCSSWLLGVVQEVNTKP